MNTMRGKVGSEENRENRCKNALFSLLLIGFRKEGRASIADARPTFDKGVEKIASKTADFLYK